MLKKYKFSQGFTLLELAVVLVVIGLIAGGVLVGRELIQQAQIRKQMAQLDEYNVSINTFRGKYNCMPGDCATAEQLGLGDGTGLNGDGNGDINTIDEPLMLWYHLFKAGLHETSYPIGPSDPIIPDKATPPVKLKGQGFIYPTQISYLTYGFNEAGGVWLFSSVKVDYQSATPLLTLGYSWGLLSTLDYNSLISLNQGLYKGTIPLIIDTKFDDGRPLTGRIISNPGNTTISSSGGPIYQPSTNGYYSSKAFVSPNSCLASPFGLVTLKYAASPSSSASACLMLIKADF